jgi:hypothetical protein
MSQEDDRQDDSRADRDVAKLLWYEGRVAFPGCHQPPTGRGPQRVCLLKLARTSAEFHYVDWMRGKRPVARFARSESGRLVLQSLGQS